MENHNPHYNDCYFSEDGGAEESQWVFYKGNSLDLRESENQIFIGETGFGTGLNLLVTAQLWRSDHKSQHFSFYSIEKYPLSPKSVNELLGHWSSRFGKGFVEYIHQYEKFYKTMKAGWNNVTFSLFGVDIKCFLYIGDVLDGLQNFPFQIDAWYLDGHDPDKNPEMWTDEVFRLMFTHSHSGTTLATYTAKGIVKRGLRNAGFLIKRQRGFGSKRHMISGVLP